MSAMNLRERLRRALHEFTRSEADTGPAEKKTIRGLPGAEAPFTREHFLPGNAVDNGPWQCCYCGEHIYSPFAPDTPLVLSNSVVFQNQGHVSCGQCWLKEHIQWPCRQSHKLNRG